MRSTVTVAGLAGQPRRNRRAESRRACRTAYPSRELSLSQARRGRRLHRFLLDGRRHSLVSFAHRVRVRADHASRSSPKDKRLVNPSPPNEPARASSKLRLRRDLHRDKASARTVESLDRDIEVLSLTRTLDVHRDLVTDAESAELPSEVGEAPDTSAVETHQ